MRYVIVVIDGQTLAGEEGGLWAALENGMTTHIDRLCEQGRVGVATTTPIQRPSLGAGLLTLLGCDASSISCVSPALLRAAGSVEHLGPGDWVMRLGLVSVTPGDDDGAMLECEPLSRDEAGAVVGDLVAHWREACSGHTERMSLRPDGPGWLLIDRDGPDYSMVETSPPEHAVGEPWVEHLPDGGNKAGSDRLCDLIGESWRFLPSHPVNLARAEQGLPPANLAWIWDAGNAGGLAAGESSPPPPADVAMVYTDHPEAIGAARLIGLETASAELDVLADTIAASAREVVIAVVGGGIGHVDRDLIGPLVDAMGGFDSDSPRRLLVAVSHDPEGGPTPFVLAGGWVRSVVPRRFAEARSSDMLVDPGCELLEYVLRAGLRGVQM